MFQIRDPVLFVKMGALLAGIFGIMVASYGNAVLGQFPTGLLIYASMAYVFMAPELDEQLALSAGENKPDMQT
jgi:hypothetical protein